MNTDTGVLNDRKNLHFSLVKFVSEVKKIDSSLSNIISDISLDFAKSIFKVELFFPLSDNKKETVFILTNNQLFLGDRIICKFNNNIEIIDKLSIDNTSEETKFLKDYYFNSAFTDKDDIKIYNELVTSLCNYDNSKIKHIDQTDLDTFNIDPTDSRDFDDAITIEKNKIYVHIVDFPSGVQASSIEDINAFLVNQTLYLPGSEPLYILPENLACNKLSLVKGELRKTLTVEFQVDNDSNIIKTDIYPSIIKVKNRYDYETDAIKNSNNPDINWISKFIDKHKFTAYNVPLSIYKLQDGKIIPNSFYIKNDQIGSIECFNKDLITTLMILANSTVSKYVSKFIFAPERFHPKPFRESDKTIYDKCDFTDDLSATLKTKLMIKDNLRAQYSIDQKSHSGLKLDDYTHFTSPARRFLDTIIQRIIWASWNMDEKELLGILTKERDNLEHVVFYCNKRQLINKKLQNYIKFLQIYRYILSDKSKIYDSVIIDCNKVGITCFIESLSIETKIHVSKLGKEYFVFDETNKILKGKTLSYKIGNSIKLTNPSSDPLLLRLNFDLYF
jgi:ribonuclease R